MTGFAPARATALAAVVIHGLGTETAHRGEAMTGTAVHDSAVQKLCLGNMVARLGRCASRCESAAVAALARLHGYGRVIHGHIGGKRDLR